MAAQPIFLKDNSWHVVQPDESMYDSFGRKPLSLKKLDGNTAKHVCSLSSYTIGELMDISGDVYVWPNVHGEVDDGLKKQSIFSITEKDGKSIDSITTNNIVGFIGYNGTDIHIRSRFSKDKDDLFLYYMME